MGTTITLGQEAGEGQWRPTVGEELLSLTKAKLGDESAAGELQRSALEILRQCVPPAGGAGGAGGSPASKTGLVVGRVQSGKTLSFSAVTAAAQDNGYRLVVVLAGTQINLAEQTRDRLVNDLRMRTNPRRPWATKHNPSSQDAGAIRGVLASWDDPAVPERDRHTYVLTVMKNGTRLANLTKLLGQLRDVIGTAIIIDDEADQAGLNTLVRRGRQSPTYAAILALRDALPRHTYLQYTATPQGNLLISLIDLLSPNFAYVLRPGPGYVGGEDFFRSGGGEDLIEVIPPGDIQDDDGPDPQPPASLHEAMRMFFLGVADYNADEGLENRSMMVHPSRLRDAHDLFFKWVKAAASQWSLLLDDEGGRGQVLADFRKSHADLKATVGTLRPFEELAPHLRQAMKQTRFEKVNSDGDSDLPWNETTSWLLVGGQNLDRGFTVEGLTVTYMPRGIGVGNADTIQQRGRFFGYKRSYLGYCRLFLEAELREAYEQYVQHERSIHDWLLGGIAEGTPLNKLKRELRINKKLQPTRAAVMAPQVFRSRMEANWFRQHTALDDADACRRNLERFEDFVGKRGIELRPDQFGAPGGDRRRHGAAEDVPLTDLYENLLVDLEMPGDVDAQDWSTVLFLVRDWIEKHEGEPATVVRMRPGAERAGRATSVDRKGVRSITNPFAGQTPERDSKRGAQGSIYPGDRAVHSNRVTLQLHVFDLYDGAVARSQRDGRPPLASGVPVAALWLDEPLLSDLVTLEPDE